MGKYQGFYTRNRKNPNLDVVIVEATDILEDGSVVPGASVGATPELMQIADKVRPRWHCALGSRKEHASE